MKTTILKITFIFLLLGLMGVGCEKKEKATTDDFLEINDVSAEVYNNDSQAVPPDELIWSLLVDENSMLKTQPYRGNYLIPKNLPDEFKIKGLKVNVSGKILLKELGSIWRSGPADMITPSYRFETTSINKLIK
jgi:hypothetical protein